MLNRVCSAVLSVFLLAAVPFSAAAVSAEEAVSVALTETEQFVADVAASYEARKAREEQYTNAELNDMTDKEYIEAHLYYAEAEVGFLEKYREMSFEDLNIQYLCKKYCDSIEQAVSCCEDYSKSKDYAAWAKAWGRAEEKRAAVVVELADLYKAEFSDIESLKELVSAADDTSDAETRNKSVDRTTVQHVQQMLNEIGFLCGAADGAAGKMTVSSVKRFQEVYEYEPADGIIDDELVVQLEEALAEKQAAVPADTAS